MIEQVRTTMIGFLTIVLVVLPGTAPAAGPDYSGTWVANVKRFGKDTCRKRSPKKLKLKVTVRNKSANRIEGVITGNGKPIPGTGTPFPTAFNIWRVVWSNSKKYGRCTTQEGIHVAEINSTTMQANKVDFNHNINCHKGNDANSHHSYSCHYTYKGKARKLK